MITIKSKYKKETTNLFNIFLKVVRYTEIRKKNEKDMVNSISVNILIVEI